MSAWNDDAWAMMGSLKGDARMCLESSNGERESVPWLVSNVQVQGGYFGMEINRNQARLGGSEDYLPLKMSLARSFPGRREALNSSIHVENEINNRSVNSDKVDEMKGISHSINKNSSSNKRKRTDLALNTLIDDSIAFVNPFSPTPIDSESDFALQFFSSSSSGDKSTGADSDVGYENIQMITSVKSAFNENKKVQRAFQVQKQLQGFEPAKLTRECLESIVQNKLPITTTSSQQVPVNKSSCFPPPRTKEAWNKNQSKIHDETKIEINVDTNDKLPLDPGSSSRFIISGTLKNNTTLVIDSATPKDSTRILPGSFHIIQSPLDGKHRILSNQFKLRTACDRCTKMKIKCIPLRPGKCEGCNKRNKDCIFSPQKKRGPASLYLNQPSGAVTNQQ